MSYAAYLAAVFAALSIAAVASRAGGPRLAIALVVLGVGVGSINILIESFVFAVTDVAQTLVGFAANVPVFVILGVAAAVISDRFGDRGAVLVRPRVTLLRLAGVMAAYVALYIGAGLLAFPRVADFYADKTLPPLAQLIPLQMVRALLFVAFAYPLLRLAPRHGPLVLGTAFSILGGIAPLLLDNPLMPPEVRLVHGIEVGISNFLFGVVAGLLLRSSEKTGAPRLVDSVS